VQRFESHEHRDIGDAAGATGELDIDLGGRKLTHAEMIALAGDFFGSLQQIKDLAKSDEGKAKLRWTVWFAFHEGAEPPLDGTAKQEIRDRYFKLAGDNITHFGAGGTAKESYRTYHELALELAFFSGASVNPTKWEDARLHEAFGHHYLTDLFSAGHVRTPRQAIEEWYGGQPNFANSITILVDYMATFVLDEIYREAKVDHPVMADPDSGKVSKEFTGFTGWMAGVFDTEPIDLVKTKIREMGGAALEAFSLADIVSLAFHDQDNKGLLVVSDADATGKLVPGGYRWQAKGDGHLGESPDTLAMVTAAVKASMDELGVARAAGVQASGGQSLPDAKLKAAFVASSALHPPFGAEKYIPREDTTDKASTNAPMGWKWGDMNDVMYNAVDAAVKGKIAYTLNDKAPSEPMHKSGYHLHVDKAVASLAKHLQSEGIRALEAALGVNAR
jgi:hypothetical protein